MRKQASKSIFFFIAITLAIFSGCSEPAPVGKETAKEPASKAAEESQVKPSFGELSFKLPKGWIAVKQQQQAASASKESESLSFIRKIDQSLWANPGPVGTSNLPMMNITITRRAAEASRDDINPKKLGNNLVKQRIFTELVKAEEVQVTSLPATKIVGDSPAQGRVHMVLLPHNGYLYKWSLYGTKPDDAESAGALESVLGSAQFGATK